MFLPFLSIAQSTEEQLFEQATSYYNAKEYEKAYPLYLEQANNGNAKAQCVMGHYYFYGYSPVKENYAKAYEWYKKAAEQGVGTAMNNIGSMYENGLFVEQDYEKAYQYYMKAVDVGFAFSASNIGKLFRDNLLPERYSKCHIEEAERWYKVAAELDSVCGFADLANFYEKTGPWDCHKKYWIAEDSIAWEIRHHLADSLLLRSAANGCRRAQRYLGSKYFLADDYVSALKYFTMAKNNGATDVNIYPQSIPIDIIIIICNYFINNPDISYYSNFCYCSSDSDATFVSSEQGFVDFIIQKRKTDEYEINELIGSVRLSLDGKVIRKTPIIHYCVPFGLDNEFCTYRSF